MAPKQQVQLIPWDFASPEHFKRLVQQREICGWDYTGLEAWKAIQENGTFNLQWIVCIFFFISLPPLPAEVWHPSRYLRNPIQRRTPRCSRLPKRTPKKRSRCSIPRFRLVGSQGLFPRLRGLLSPSDISALVKCPRPMRNMDLPTGQECTGYPTFMSHVHFKDAG